MEATSQLIFDIGANSGSDSAFYLAKGFRVIAVEAHPILAASIGMRCADYRNRLSVVPVAIAGEPGNCVLLCHEAESQWGTIRKDAAARKAGAFTALTVPAVTFDSLIRQYGTPYYLKVDIEGAELDVFRKFPMFREFPQWVSFEVSQDIGEILSILIGCGYTRFQAVNQRIVPSMRPPVPAREGEYADWTFGGDSSGLFGRELPEDAWIAASEIRAAFTTIEGNCDPAIDWFDIHAQHGSVCPQINSSVKYTS
ncbi:MAG: FkbM family methyltransferase [Bryobacteraceae bacterium]